MVEQEQIQGIDSQGVNATKSTFETHVLLTPAEYVAVVRGIDLLTNWQIPQGVQRVIDQQRYSLDIDDIFVESRRQMLDKAKKLRVLRETIREE